MKCKIMTGTKINVERQLQAELDMAREVISITTTSMKSADIVITIVYIPKVVQQ